MNPNPRDESAQERRHDQRRLEDRRRIDKIERRLDRMDDTLHGMQYALFGMPEDTSPNKGLVGAIGQLHNDFEKTTQTFNRILVTVVGGIVIDVTVRVLLAH